MRRRFEIEEKKKKIESNWKPKASSYDKMPPVVLPSVRPSDRSTMPCVIPRVYEDSNSLRFLFIFLFLPFHFLSPPPVHVKIGILDRMAEIEYRLASGTNEKLQLSSLIAAFQTARELTLQEEPV